MMDLGGSFTYLRTVKTSLIVIAPLFWVGEGFICLEYDTGSREIKTVAGYGCRGEQVHSNIQVQTNLADFHEVSIGFLAPRAFLAVFTGWAFIWVMSECQLVVCSFDFTIRSIFLDSKKLGQHEELIF